MQLNYDAGVDNMCTSAKNGKMRYRKTGEKKSQKIKNGQFCHYQVLQVLEYIVPGTAIYGTQYLRRSANTVHSTGVQDYEVLSGCRSGLLMGVTCLSYATMDFLFSISALRLRRSSLFLRRT